MNYQTQQRRYSAIYSVCPVGAPEGVFNTPPIQVNCRDCGSPIGLIIHRSRGRTSRSPALSLGLVKITTGSVECRCGTVYFFDAAKSLDEVMMSLSGVQ